MRVLSQNELGFVAAAALPWEVSAQTCMEGFNSKGGVYDYFMSRGLGYALLIQVALAPFAFPLLAATEAAKDGALLGFALFGPPFMGLMFGCRIADYCTTGK